MKDLKRYLNPKAQWHTPKEYSFNSLSIRDIIDILENEGFSECNRDGIPVKSMGRATLCACLNNDKSIKRYIFRDDKDRNQHWIRFCGEGEITESSPVFTIIYRIYNGDQEQRSFYIEDKSLGAYEVDYKMFSSKLEKVFNWKIN